MPWLSLIRIPDYSQNYNYIADRKRLIPVRGDLDVP